MTMEGLPGGGPGRDLDALIDAFFDGELSAAEESALLDLVDRDPVAAERFARTAWVIDEIRRPMSAPDFSGSVMSRVHGRRAWLSDGWRRFVGVGRLVAAACLLLALAGGLAARRMAPDSVTLGTQAGPLSQVVDAGRVEAASGAMTISSTFDIVRGAAKRGEAAECEGESHAIIVRSCGGAEFSGERTAPSTIWSSPAEASQSRATVIVVKNPG